MSSFGRNDDFYCWVAERASIFSAGLGDVDLMEAEAVEQGGDGGAGVFAGGVENAVGECGLLELLLGLGSGVGLEVLVDGHEKASGAGVDAGVLVVERGDEELGGGEGNVDGLAAVLAFDADVFGFELAEVDSGDRLAVDDKEETVAGEEVGKDGAGFGAFDHGVNGVDDGFEAVETLNTLDDRGDGGVEGGGAAGDCGSDAREDAGRGMTDKYGECSGAKDERQQDDEEGSGGAAA